MAMLEPYIAVILGIIVGTTILTLAPWQLKLRAIEKKAEEDGVEPILPKFNPFYLVSGGISIIISGALNLSLVQPLLEANSGSETGILFIISMLSAMGANAAINLTTKTGSPEHVIFKEKPGASVSPGSVSPPTSGDKPREDTVPTV